ncbi:hypothetical protein [Streptomyces sp. A5-4]|uniref:hypothetical protein n=1 Tax=Streptomyces sp. A5-4 TaxID=3384771 RepID=UPI003DA88D88
MIPGRYAATRVLGRHAWYAPRSLRRLHARVGLDEAPGAPGALARRGVNASEPPPDVFGGGSLLCGEAT